MVGIYCVSTAELIFQLIILYQAPTGGVIEVDSQGIPTGIVKERACELIVAAQQKQSVGGSSAIAQKMRFLSDGMAMCAKVGLTSVQTNDEGALK